MTSSMITKQHKETAKKPMLPASVIRFAVDYRFEQNTSGVLIMWCILTASYD